MNQKNFIVVILGVLCLALFFRVAYRVLTIDQRLNVTIDTDEIETIKNLGRKKLADIEAQRTRMERVGSKNSSEDPGKENTSQDE